MHRSWWLSPLDPNMTKDRVFFYACLGVMALAFLVAVAVSLVWR